MNNFKDILINDLSNTFLKQEEFGSINTWDGAEFIMIVDEIVDEDVKAPPGKWKGIDDEIYKKKVKVFINKKDITKPIINQVIFFSDEEYKVIKCNDMDGMYEVTLEANN